MKTTLHILLIFLWLTPLLGANESGEAALTAESDSFLNENEVNLIDIPRMTEVLPGTITRAFFTNGIENREPLRVLNRIENDRTDVYFFSELIDFTGQSVSHRWIYDGIIEAEVEFEIDGPRWRVWSRKNIPATQRGPWQVDVIDQAGMIIDSYTIFAQ